MLIVIAGLIGAGKSSIAREVSKRLNIPLYSIDEDKKRIYKQHPQYEFFLKNNIPFPDETRRKTFEASLDGLRILVKKHEHVIVEETFHKKSLRKPFFEEAKKIFGGMILTLVTVDDKLVKKRLEKREKEENHMVGYGMYLSFKKQWEPFENVDYHFVNEGEFEKNMQKYIKFLKKRLVPKS
ncbi:AAA family ATPase [Candidatus Woesearchaeota archaeon]|nr:AAA family ATPase [Candidatus Woesearchaeota archaeon]